MEKPCPFCEGTLKKIIENEWAFCIEDKFPVSRGHSLVIPKVHVSDLFALPEKEYTELFQMVRVVRNLLTEKYEPQGFNVGVNCGKAAGQTVPHVHVHVIPRYRKDVVDPTGGVRGVIPDKQKYQIPGKKNPTEL